MGDEKKKKKQLWMYGIFKLLDGLCMDNIGGCSHHGDELGFPLQDVPCFQSSSHFHSKIWRVSCLI